MNQATQNEMQQADQICILGVDPGVGGGWALLTPGSEAAGQERPMDKLDLQLGTFPTWTSSSSKGSRTHIHGPHLMATWRKLRITHAYVEQVSSRPRQAGQWLFGFNTGVLHGILHALHVPITLVPPQTWKAAYGLRREEDETKADVKSAARRLAQKLFPAYAGAFSKVRDDGLAEAALMALYGYYVMAAGKDTQ